MLVFNTPFDWYAYLKTQTEFEVEEIQLFWTNWIAPALRQHVSLLEIRLTARRAMAEIREDDTIAPSSARYSIREWQLIDEIGCALSHQRKPIIIERECFIPSDWSETNFPVLPGVLVVVACEGPRLAPIQFIFPSH